MVLHILYAKELVSKLDGHKPHPTDMVFHILYAKELVSKLDGHKPHPPTWFSTSCMLKNY